MWIDQLTPCLVDRQTGKIVDTDYNQLGLNEIRKIQGRQEWKFDWEKQWRNQEPGSEFYGLTLKGESEVQGLIHCVIEQGCVKAGLVESAPHNIGKNGRFKGVGAHLFAIASKRSFEIGGNGVVYFDAKTRLIRHYKKELQASVLFGNRMVIEEKAATRLLREYYKGGEK